VFGFLSKCFSEIFLCLKRIKLNIITNVQSGLHVQWRLFLSDFNKSLIFFSYPHKIISNFMKSVQLEPSFCMQTDGLTKNTKVTVAFHNFADRLKWDITFCTHFVHLTIAIKLFIPFMIIWTVTICDSIGLIGRAVWGFNYFIPHCDRIGFGSPNDRDFASQQMIRNKYET